MAFKIEFTAPAKKEMRALPKEAFFLLDSVFARLINDPFNISPRPKKLEAPFEGYRIRKGDYRILFEVEGDIVTVYRVRHRKDAYR